MPIVSRDPDSVDQPLVVGMDCDCVFAFVQVFGYIDFIVEIPERVRSRSFPGQLSIDVEFIVVVR